VGFQIRTSFPNGSVRRSFTLFHPAHPYRDEIGRLRLKRQPQYRRARWFGMKWRRLFPARCVPVAFHVSIPRSPVNKSGPSGANAILASQSTSFRPPLLFSPVRQVSVAPSAIYRLCEHSWAGATKMRLRNSLSGGPSLMFQSEEMRFLNTTRWSLELPPGWTASNSRLLRDLQSAALVAEMSLSPWGFSARGPGTGE